jgi:hypothetical protein
VSSQFWLGVAQTAIGSALGFVFGIFAFHYQQRRQAAKKEKDNWRSALDALNRLTTAAGANIEAREHFLEYKLIPAAAEAMPKEELFPLMREQLATFES